MRASLFNNKSYLERESNPHPTITSDPRLRRERLPIPPPRHKTKHPCKIHEACYRYTKESNRSSSCVCLVSYLERASTPQSLRNQILNLARLPVSPSRHKGEFYSAGFSEPPHLALFRIICIQYADWHRKTTSEGLSDYLFQTFPWNVCKRFYKLWTRRESNSPRFPCQRIPPALVHAGPKINSRRDYPVQKP